MRLTPKLIAAFILTALVPLAALGYLSYIAARPALEKQVANSMVLAADAIEGHLYSYFDAIRGRVLDFSSDGHIRADIRNLAQLPPSSPRYTEIQTALGEYLRRYKMSLDTSIRAIAILNSDGKVVASTDERYLGLDESGRDYFIEGKKRPFLSGTLTPPLVQTQEQAWLIPCSAPLTTIKTGELLGVIINFYEPRGVEQIMSGSFQTDRGAPTSMQRTGSALEVYLVDRNRQLLTPSRHGGIPLKQLIDSKPVKECESGRETSGVYTNYAGIEVIGSSMCFPGTGWTLLVETPTAEAFAPTRKLRNNFIAMGIVIALTVTLTAYLLARRIAKPVLRLSKATQKLGSGDYGIQVAVTSRDEIGELTSSFNAMVARLAESRTEANAEKNRLETLIREISEGVAFADASDNILMLNPKAEQILGVNEIDLVGKPLHTCHSRGGAHLAEVLKAFKQGKHEHYVTELTIKDRHFEVTMSPIWQEGSYVGTIKVLHDITEHKLAEEAVNQANEKLTKWVAELEERNREIALLSSLDELLQACRTSDEAYQLIAQYSEKLFPLSSGTIYAFNASRNHLECTGGWGPHYTNNETLTEHTFIPEDC
ncbi:MAG: HAMP domain-containing protein, partial [Nitrospirota bacterium]|nr:HAMP domain-containing protein [Nitrospirota bacterium]